MWCNTLRPVESKALLNILRPLTEPPKVSTLVNTKANATSEVHINNESNQSLLSWNFQQILERAILSSPQAGQYQHLSNTSRQVWSYVLPNALRPGKPQTLLNCNVEKSSRFQMDQFGSVFSLMSSKQILSSPTKSQAPKPVRSNALPVIPR